MTKLLLAVAMIIFSVPAMADVKPSVPNSEVESYVVYTQYGRLMMNEWTPLHNENISCIVTKSTAMACYPKAVTK